MAWNGRGISSPLGERGRACPEPVEGVRGIVKPFI